MQVRLTGSSYEYNYFSVGYTHSRIANSWVIVNDSLRHVTCPLKFLVAGSFSIIDVWLAREYHKNLILALHQKILPTDLEHYLNSFTELKQLVVTPSQKSS